MTERSRSNHGRALVVRSVTTIAALVLVSAASLAFMVGGCGTAGTGAGPGSTGPGGSGTSVTGPKSTGPSVTSPGSTVPAGGSTTTVAGIAHSTGKSDLVMQITVAGGLTTPEVSLYSIPQFSLYGDGRAIVVGPTDAIYPPAALPNLQTTVVSEDVVQRILQAAKRAGLFDPAFDYGRPGITDVGTTTFVVNAEGQSFQTHVYALGFESDAGELTSEQQQARAALSELTSRLADLTSFTTKPPTWGTYDFSAIAVYSSITQPGATDSTDVQPNRLDWPLADLSTLGTEVQGGLRRVVVSGTDLTALRPLLSQATSITLWRSAGKYYHVFLRPLLPDQNN